MADPEDPTEPRWHTGDLRPGQISVSVTTISTETVTQAEALAAELVEDMLYLVHEGASQGRVQDKVADKLTTHLTEAERRGHIKGSGTQMIGAIATPGDVTAGIAAGHFQANRLETAAGGFVALVATPRWLQPALSPSVLIWGNRTFVRYRVDEQPATAQEPVATYREAFAAVVVLPEVPA